MIDGVTKEERKIPTTPLDTDRAKKAPGRVNGAAVHATASREREPRVTRRWCDLRMNTRVDTDPCGRVTRGSRYYR
jgi:hypothetical protein